MCLCVTTCVCVYHCVQSLNLILRSSPIHPLILLTYSPNPVIPRFFFTPALYPFISLSCYLSLAPTAPLSLDPIPAQLPCFDPPGHLQSLQSCPPSIPLDPVLARLSRCLKALHQGFFSAEFSPSHMKMQCKELHSHLSLSAS